LSRKIRQKQKQNEVLATKMLNDNGKYRKNKKQNEQLMNETLKDL